MEKRETRMSTIHVEATQVINARPEEIYAVLSDYRVAHPAILPKPYFTDLVVEKGGQGAGTVTRVLMKVWGTEFKYHQIVSEPEPGRVLVETDLETGQFTKFIFEPLNGGTQTRLTIASEFPASQGFKGFMEKLMQPPVARGIYMKEMANIAQYVQTRRTAVSAG